MAIPKSKKNVGLGQAIIKARFKGRSRPRDGDERLVSTHNNNNNNNVNNGRYSSFYFYFFLQHRMLISMAIMFIDLTI
jgi:hypothetical protein